MDYNDGFNPKRLNQEEITELRQTRINDEENAENCVKNNFWRPLNGVLQQGMYNSLEHQIPEENFYHKNVSTGHFEKTHAVPLGNFNDILSTNKQNMEGRFKLQKQNLQMVNNFNI